MINYSFSLSRLFFTLKSWYRFTLLFFPCSSIFWVCRLCHLLLVLSVQVVTGVLNEDLNNIFNNIITFIIFVEILQLPFISVPVLK
jgi:hypothetical protein